MARNSEVIRQWEILRDIDAARTGIPIAKITPGRRVTSKVEGDVDSHRFRSRITPDGD